MADGIQFPESTLILGPPEGMSTEDCKPLPVFRDDTQFISKWRLTPEELKEVNETGCVWLYIVSGTHPVVCVTGKYPFKVAETEVVDADFEIVKEPAPSSEKFIEPYADHS